MPSQHSEAKRAVTFRLPRDLVDAYKAVAEANGEDATALVERAIRSEITTPPPDGQR